MHSFTPAEGAETTVLILIRLRCVFGGTNQESEIGQSNQEEGQ
jgi:hypothetical protein